MKNTVLALIALICFLNLQAQTPDVHWIKSYQSATYSGENYPNELSQHLVTSDGGYLWAGQMKASGADHSDILVIKFNSNGIKVWEKLINGEKSATLIDLAQNPDGTYLMAVSSSSLTGDYINSTSNGSVAVSVVFKLSSIGTSIWSSFLQDNIQALSSLNDGSFVVAGKYASTCGCSEIFGCLFGYDCMKSFIAHHDSNGDELTYYTDDNAFGVTDLIQTPTGDLILIGEGIAVAYSFPDINLLWIYSHPDFSVNDVCISSEGNIFVTGARSETTDIGPFSYEIPVSAAFALLSPEGSEIYYQEIPSINNILYATSDLIAPQGNGGCVLQLAGGTQFVAYDSAGSILYNVSVGNNMSMISLESQGPEIFTVFGFPTLGNTDYPDGVLYAKFGPTAISTMDPLSMSNCAGKQIDISWTATSEIDGIFEVQLSNENGSFANPTSIGTGNSSPITCIIPADTEPGSGYRVRVVRPSPEFIGNANPTNIEIYSFQQSAFSESMGVVASNITVAAHESAGGFDNDDFTMSGSAMLSNTNTSSGYSGASGGANIFLGSTNGTNFQIAGINTSGIDVYSISFGYYRTNSGGGNTPMALEVSSDGTTYTPLTIPSASGTGWFLFNATGNIPNTPNLRIRFTRQSGQNSNMISIDDIQINKSNSNLGITASGPLNFCADQGSVVLTGPSTGNWIWNTGASTQSINVTETGTYSCQTTASDGCIAQTPSVEVTNALTTFYLDTDADGFGVESDFQILCAADNLYNSIIPGDCNDSDPEINISKPEICNGIDDNCDGLIDEGFDVDNDGYRVCDGDCSDNNPYINPGATELSNGIDDNCDGVIDAASVYTWYIDNDGDGYGSPFYVSHEPIMPSGFAANYFDCNDNESSVHPGAEEICSDNLDNNCDGLVNNCSSSCMGDLDNNGAVNVSDLLLFVGAYGTICGN